MRLTPLLAAVLLVAGAAGWSSQTSAEQLVPAHVQEASGPPGLAIVDLYRGITLGDPAKVLRTPTPEDPLRIYFAGDSMAGYPGLEMSNALPSGLPVEIRSESVVSSGLAAQWFFHWPDELSLVLAEFDADVVVLSMGGNDNQAIDETSYGSAHWSYLYEQRAAELLEIATANHRLIIWVGMPPMRNPQLNGALPLMNSLTKQAIGDRLGFGFVDTWTIFASDTDEFQRTIDLGEGAFNARAGDGVHYTRAGARVVADEVALLIREAIEPG